MSLPFLLFLLLVSPFFLSPASSVFAEQNGRTNTFPLWLQWFPRSWDMKTDKSILLITICPCKYPHPLQLFWFVLHLSRTQFLLYAGLKPSWHAALVFWLFSFTCRMWKRVVKLHFLTSALKWSRPRAKPCSGLAPSIRISRCRTIAQHMRQNLSFEEESLLQIPGFIFMILLLRISGVAQGPLIKSDYLIRYSAI